MNIELYRKNSFSKEKEIKLKININSPDGVIKLEEERKKELMFLRKLIDAGYKVILNEKDADLINYEEVERRYEQKCLEDLRLSK